MIGQRKSPALSAFTGGRKSKFFGRKSKPKEQIQIRRNEIQIQIISFSFADRAFSMAYADPQ